MSSVTLTLPYVRFVRQVQSGPGSLPQFAAMMQSNYVKLQAATWVQSDADLQSVAMPANQPLTFAMDGKFDAFKMSSTVSASGVETAYAGMAAYRFTIPADATTNHKYIRALSINVGADKFAYSGIKVAVHASNTATPSTDWAMLRAGGYGTTVDTNRAFATYDANPEVYGVLTGHVANVVDATNQASTLIFDLSGLGNTDYTYLWVYVSMFDYTDYRANRPYWVEGSGIVNGATNVVTFASAVTEDASTAWNGWVTAEGRWQTTETGSLAAHDACWQLKVDPVGPYTSRQVASGFPMVSSTGFTVTRTDGSTGFEVGFDSSEVCSGGYLIRYLPVATGKTLTKLRFSGATPLSMSGKTFAMNMNVWSAVLPFPTSVTTTTDWWLACDLKTDETGLYQADLFHGSSVNVVRRVWKANTGANPNPPPTYLPDYSYFPAVAMTLAGRFTLKEANYTSDSEYTVSIAGGGTVMVLVTLNPVDYWGSIGAATKATFTPGTYIYLK